jgi:hypothetical protein
MMHLFSGVTSSTGPVVLVLSRDEDGDLQLDDVEGSKERETEHTLSDVECAHEEWNACGARGMLGDDDLPPGDRYRVRGRVVYSRHESMDGTEYDMEFEIDVVLVEQP